MKALAYALGRGLKDILYVETALAPALQSLAEAAAHKELRGALERHAAETVQQAKIVKDILRSVGMKAETGQSAALEGLLADCRRSAAEAEASARDAIIVVGAQTIKHYEIARYGALREWAKTLGYDEAHMLLTTILDEERAANLKLNNLAINSLNPTAI